MKLGIVGLPNVGKTTLFNALTGSKAATSSYAYTSVTPNIGVAKVPDSRLDWLAELYDPDKYTPATVDFVDVAGLARGASRGEGLGNAFLQAIRQTDALLHVVRCFDNEDMFVEPADARRDAEALELELILADIEVVERRMEKAKKASKGGDKKYVQEEQLCAALLEHLSNGKAARYFDFGTAGKDILADGGLLSVKPVIYATNLSEDSMADYTADPHYQALAELAGEQNAAVFPVSARFEEEIGEMDPEDAQMFMEELGLKERSLGRLIRCSYNLLGLIYFLTAGKPEVRAWTITKGTKAPRAAGKIHSDIERGFIRAEIVAFDDLKACGSMAAAKEKGLVRLEGKDYVMKDGDVTLFRFNV